MFLFIALYLELIHNAHFCVCRSMPHHCIVPLCTSHSSDGSSNSDDLRISFYRLPLNNPLLLKQWLVNIRRENTPINHNSRVCSLHFKGGRKIGKLDVPVIFPWTKKL